MSRRYRIEGEGFPLTVDALPSVPPSCAPRRVLTRDEMIALTSRTEADEKARLRDINEKNRDFWAGQLRPPVNAGIEPQASAGFRAGEDDDVEEIDLGGAADLDRTTEARLRLMNKRNAAFWNRTENNR